MIALLRIHCPHCGVAGQILMPPPGAIIIGPCPECRELVAIFAGAALALDAGIMNEGAVREKYEHVMRVLSGYLEKQVRQCFSDAESAAQITSDTAEEADDALTEPGLITEDEIRHFVETELPKLDAPEFFNHFG